MLGPVFSALYRAARAARLRGGVAGWRRGAGWPPTLCECYGAGDVVCAEKRLHMPTGAPAGGKRTIAVVLCAGQGTRLGAGQNKVFLPLAGRPLVVYAVAALTACPAVHGVLLVAHPREVAYCETEIVSRYRLSTVIGVVAGGASRHQSEERALAVLRPQIEAGALDMLLIHDGARPFVAPDDVARLIAAPRGTGGAALATALAPDEVVARVGADGTLAAMYGPDELWRPQTPQAFDPARPPSPDTRA